MLWIYSNNGIEGHRDDITHDCQVSVDRALLGPLVFSTPTTQGIGVRRNGSSL